MDSCPLDLPLLISVSTVANSFKIEGPATEFILLPPVNVLSDYEDELAWSTLSEGFDNVINDPTILLDKFILPDDLLNNLVEGIRIGTASIFSDGCSDVASPIGPVGPSVGILASSTEYHRKYWTNDCNWVTGPKSSQSVYRSELAGIIASLIILDIFVQHHNITEGAVTIALDKKTAMDKSRRDWPLSIDPKCFNFLQVICAWIKPSPLTFNSRHVKGHQTDKVPYDQLDWLEQRNKDVDRATKAFLHTCTAGSLVDQKVHIQSMLHLEKWALARDRTKCTSIWRDSLYTNLYGSCTLVY